MSSVKCIGAMAALGAAATGGMALYNGMKSRKLAVSSAETIAANNGGKIPTGGMKNGVLWDGFTTVDQVKKDTKKAVAMGTGIGAVLGGLSTAVIAGLTLLAKAKIK